MKLFYLTSNIFFVSAYHSQWYDNGEHLHHAWCNGDHAWRSGDDLLKVGDKLEIYIRTGLASYLYCHWGIVRRVTRDLKQVEYMDFSATEEGAASEVVTNFTLSSCNITKISTKVRVNNDSDARYTPASEKTIQSRIESVRNIDGLLAPYHAVTNNCEYFVNYIRYGERFSSRTKQIVATILRCNIQ